MRSAIDRAGPVRRWLPAACLALGAAVSHAAGAGTLQHAFDVEGPAPFDGDRLVFSALRAAVLTGNGHGLRHELKRPQRARRAMHATRESLAGELTFRLSPGAKTIVVQIHDGGTGTLFKLYVGDVHDRRLANGIAGDGVFDVYARIALPEGGERLVPFGALPSGGRFAFALANDRGTLTLDVDGRTVTQRTPDAPGVFLKFGDYLQAQDAETGRQAPHAEIPGFYAARGITVDEIVFERLRYTRDDPDEP